MADSTPPSPETSVPEHPVSRHDNRLHDEWFQQLGDEFEKGYWFVTAPHTMLRRR